MQKIQYLVDRFAVVIPFEYEAFKFGVKDSIENEAAAKSATVGLDARLDKVMPIKGTQRGKKRGLSSRYMYNYKIVLKNKSGEEFVVLISIFPHCKSHRFFRAEFNPGKAKYSGCVLINMLIRYWLKLDYLESVYDIAFLKRVDLCRDARGDLCKFFPYYPKATVSEIIFNKKTGKQETFLIGASESDNRKSIYDKDAESVRKGGVVKGVIRCEHQFGSMSVPLSRIDLDYFSGKVGRMVFYSSSLLRSKIFSSKFKSDMRVEGINKALSKCTHSQKRRYKRVLDKKHRCDPFNHKGRDVEIDRLIDVLNIFRKRK